MWLAFAKKIIKKNNKPLATTKKHLRNQNKNKKIPQKQRGFCFRYSTFAPNIMALPCVYFSQFFLNIITTYFVFSCVAVQRRNLTNTVVRVRVRVRVRVKPDVM